MNYLYAMVGVFVIVLSGILMDRLYTRFARKHPQLGPYRDKMQGCASCSAGDKCAEKAKASCSSQ